MNTDSANLRTAFDLRLIHQSRKSIRHFHILISQNVMAENSLLLEEEIIYLESQTWEALKISGKALIPFLAPECVMIFPGASIIDDRSKPSLREILERPDMKPWSRYEMDDVRVVKLGKEAASISYSVEAERDGALYQAFISSVWRHDANAWKMCLHQQTPAKV